MELPLQGIWIVYGAFLFGSRALCQDPVESPYFLHLDCFEGSQDKQMDKAWVTLVTDDFNQSSQPYLYGQVSACFKCIPLNLTDLQSNKNCTILVDTKFDVGFVVRDNSNSTQDIVIPKNQWLNNLTEYSRYRLFIHQDFSVYITLDGKASHWHSETPLYIGFGILFGIAIVWILIRFIHSRGYFHRIISCFKDGRQINNDLGTPSIITQPDDSLSERRRVPVRPVKSRIRALDTFRGLSLTIMMFVNYGGGGYWFFKHSYWNGLTVADLVFPWFVWIMGTSIALSFHNLEVKGEKKSVVLRKIIRRFLILFALGLIINTKKGPINMSELRIPGVLQRLAFSYLCVALIELPMARADDPHRFRWWSAVRDLIPYWPQWVVALSFLAIHLSLTFFLNVPTCPRGYLGPGGLSDTKWPKCTGGAAAYIDRMAFGENHIYQHPTCKETYQTTTPYDPEGILGSLTSVFLCFLGLQAGRIILTHRDWLARTVRFLMWSGILGGIAAALSFASQNEGPIPVNKNLWSVSFVLALASMAFLLFAACYLLIDVFHIWSGTPFFFPGMNSILIYVCHEVFDSYFPITWKAPNIHAVQLALQAWGVTIWIVLSAYLYYKKIFLAV